LLSLFVPGALRWRRTTELEFKEGSRPAIWQNSLTMLEDRWPALPYDAWKDTYATLHMWTQIVGKIALALAPPINHCWAIAFHVTARGLATRPLPHSGRFFTLEFDFISHRLVIHTSDGVERALRLEPRSVADFYRELMAVLSDMTLAVKIWSMPVEIAAPIRFEDDTIHASYDPIFANRFWRIVAHLSELLTEERCGFVGKCSPAHFFWGSFDLALTRFSGRAAAPPSGPAFVRDAYSHQVISHGFWPGSGALLEPALYAYAVPDPAGFKDAKVQPQAAFFHREIGEFILPYEAVRAATSPEAAVRAFVHSTYEQAADLATWDRAALERRPPFPA
jgi:hypothetical protein